jgi:hypothetical protein
LSRVFYRLFGTLLPHDLWLAERDLAQTLARIETHRAA